VEHRLDHACGGYRHEMKCEVGEVAFHYEEHGSGTPVLVLHGAGVDHREPEACFEPVLDAVPDCRRIYPDLPGMGRTTAPPSVRSADDVLGLLLGFVDDVVGAEPLLLIGHSVGGYYAQAIAETRPRQVAGLALVCPLLPGTRDVPPQQAVVAGPGELGDEGFRGYFVVHTPAMLERHQRYVVPGVALVDPAAMERIGARWELTPRSIEGSYDRPTLLIAGRCDSTVGYAATADLLDHYPRATLAVLDGAGHALPHEQSRPHGGSGPRMARSSARALRCGVAVSAAPRTCRRRPAGLCLPCSGRPTPLAGHCGSLPTVSKERRCSVADVRVLPATADTWASLGAVFGPRAANRDSCWCQRFRRHDAADNRSALHQEIEQSATPVGLVAYQGTDPIGWTRVVPARHCRALPETER
jgi:pimeloyl-ACP methyl ester carboxylesterase